MREHSVTARLGGVIEVGKSEVFMLKRNPSARDLKKLPPEIALRPR